MILVFGSINIDLVVRVPEFARPGETVLTDSYQTAFGGKGANQAVAASRASRAPSRVIMASAVGDDAFGRIARDNLSANRVDIGFVRTVKEPTGCAFITVDKAGENAITVASGANRAVSAGAVPDTLLDEATLIVLQMEVPIAENRAIAARARARGKQVLLNLAPAPQADGADHLAALLAATDILVANEHESRAALALVTGQGAEDPEAAMAGIVRSQGLTGVVTLGAQGATAIFRDGSRRHAAATPVEVVDTTGAGDTFVGILAAVLAEGRPFEEALARACYGASLACLTVGAQAGMPDADALDRGTPQA
ncbi:MAG: ribokinase [Alphaproteobacteria bacterium]|nr:ribokinase [Alphaproteobacteria bacterium]